MGITEWTIQRNLQNGIYKTLGEDKQKTQHNMCRTPLYATNHK